MKILSPKGVVEKYTENLKKIMNQYESNKTSNSLSVLTYTSNDTIESESRDRKI
ncbi:MAG: hypothetical protein HPY66_2144 [Firmicutes bacterium]|nr:hypothetical protein [Bacillota bacterium]